MRGGFDTYWFEKNFQGDIVAVYDGAGTKLISYTYDAWGNFTTTYHNGCTASSHANLNPFRYRGYYYDSETGLYYVSSRYYDPEVGRWINHDHEWKNGERGKEHLPPDPSYKMNWEPVIGVGLIVICTVGMIAVAADDVIGVGVADDFLFEPLGAGVGEGLIMVFG